VPIPSPFDPSLLATLATSYLFPPSHWRLANYQSRDHSPCPSLLDLPILCHSSLLGPCVRPCPGVQHPSITRAILASSALRYYLACLVSKLKWPASLVIHTVVTFTRQCREYKTQRHDSVANTRHRTLAAKDGRSGPADPFHVKRPAIPRSSVQPATGGPKRGHQQPATGRRGVTRHGSGLKMDAGYYTTGGEVLKWTPGCHMTGG
jgi:hypothetical protein